MSDDLFTLIASRIPDPAKPFLILGDRSAVTYGEMLALSARLAGLLARLGVAPGDRVAAQVDKSPEALILYLA
ncbi:AMP-binding protein, partial [Salmonella enterica]|uniref:AMP-binding protein n=1 Tax=Salmonella enterica TaxID=28901 RepID=UPI003D2A4220